MFLFRFLFFTILVFSSFYSRATHIIGGELTYQHVSGSTYNIELILYKDCQPFIGPNGDTITPFGFPNVVGQPVITPGAKFAELRVYYNGSDTISFPFTNAVIESVEIDNPDPCIEFVHEYCVEKGTYTATVNLPSQSTSGFHISYQSCCRNPSSVNVVVNPFATGIVISNFIPINNHQTIQNSSPKFNELPPLSVCVNQPLDFSSVATDIDGDSLYYSIVNPNITNPAAPYNWIAPPYQPLVYEPGYSSSSPIDANPALSINQDGFLQAEPNQIGEYIIGVSVEEYRFGHLISTTIRDFRMIVFDCIVLDAEFEFEDQVCTGTSTVDFEAMVDDSLDVIWDFGDPSTIHDTSTSLLTNYTYSDDGDYEVTLITNFRNNCFDTLKQVVKIKSFIDVDLEYEQVQCINDHDINVKIKNKEFSNSASIQWLIDGVVETDFDGLEELNGLQFNTSGQHTVKVIVKENACEVEKEVIITLSEPILLTIPMDTILCGYGEFSIDPQSNVNNLSYTWYVNGMYFSNEAIFSMFADTDTTFSVQLVVEDSYGCRDSLFSAGKIEIYEQPTAGFEVLNEKLEKNDTLLIENTASNYTSISYSMDGKVLKDSTFFVIPDEGSYLLTQTVSYKNKCFDTFSKKIDANLNYAIRFPNTFTPNGDNTNDLFFPFTRNIKGYTMIIYDRWGKLMFNGSEFKEKHEWNGTDLEKKLATQKFYVVYSEYITGDDEKKSYKGVILLEK
jgi:gliding motility-associated-like protein